MTTLSQDELKALLAQAVGPCVSLYLPVHKGTSELAQDRLRLRNLLRQAEDQLAAQGLRPAAAAAVLQPARRLLDDALFWRHQDGGLALFCAPGVFRAYQAPFTFDESVTVAAHFAVRPLLPLLASGGVFYILALSQNQARLLRCTAQETRDIPLPPGTPRSMAAALQYDQFEQQRQVYTGVGRGAGGRPGAVFFGHGVGSDIEKDNLRRYCNEVDKGVCAVLREARAPLLLAAVDSLVPIYREVSDYPHLAADAIPGSPDDRSAEELCALGWNPARPLLAQAQLAALARYRDLIDTGHASGDPAQVLPAAYQGRVATLLVAAGGPQWGTFDPATGAVVVHPQAEPGDIDLLEPAIRHTLLAGGTVAAVAPEQIPAHTPLAALFRY
jgi:hypothetical protein